MLYINFVYSKMWLLIKGGHNYFYEVARVHVLVPKLQDLKTLLHHKRLTIIASSNVSYLVTRVMDSRLVSSGFRF